MALEDLSGQFIQESYQKLVQTENGKFAAGDGTAILFVTASSQLSSAISGAFSATSASLSNRITFNSSSISTRIDNLTSDSASFSTHINELQLDSASFSNRITTNTSDLTTNQLQSLGNSSAISALGVIVGTKATIESNVLFGNITSSGNISASGDIIASNLIADSGSFSTRIAGLKTDSGSFSTRVTALKTDSGSFSTRVTALKTDSGSFSTRVTNNSASLSTRVTNLKSDSGSFSTSIVGLKSDSGSFSTRVTGLKTDSGSIVSRIESLEGNTGQAVNVTSNVVFSNISSSRITASQLLVNESTRVNGTFAYNGLALFEDNIIVRSGSTIFGSGSMPSEVTHQFTGSLLITGSVHAPSFHGIFEGALSSSSQIKTEISGAIGDVSESFSTRVTALKTDSGSFSTRVTALKTDSGSFSTRVTNLKSDSGSFSTRVANLKSDSGSFSTRVTNNSASFSTRVTNNSASFSTRITTTESELGNTLISGSAQLANAISGSWQNQGFISGSQVQENIGGGIISGSDHIFTAITSSGDISGSSSLIFSSSFNNNASLKTLMYDTTSGKIFHTGSYGGGGGSGVSGGTDLENIGSDVKPDTDDEYTLGTADKKWNAVFATNTFFGGIHEINLETKDISKLQTGTVLVLKAGQLVPCNEQASPLVMGIVSSGSDYPIILGAEPVLVDGPIHEGDYIITSDRLGYGKAVQPDHIYEQKLFGKIIAQSLETNLYGGIIKAMIRKM
tara:strand:+ start:1712 stop:3919 length:2208 start_codon:yes stop_codon:yes gene_type:complete